MVGPKHKPLLAREAASSNIVHPQVISQEERAPPLDITHVTFATIEPPLDQYIDDVVDENNQESRSIFGSSLETKLIGKMFANLTIERGSPSPLVPLCRLFPNEAIQTATESLEGLKASLDNYGYTTHGSPPFFVSMKRL